MNRRKRMMEDLDQDIRDFVERETQNNIERGMSPEEARYAALRKFGNVTHVKEQTREVWSFGWLEQLGQDIRYGLRMFVKSPDFAWPAIIILALGVGANTAVFSVVNAVLLRPLSYRDPDRIVMLTNPRTTREATTALAVKLVSIPNFQDWHDQSSSFEAMAYYRESEEAVTVASTAEYAHATRVSPEFFRVFAVEPILGRLFTAEEVKPGSGGALVISYAYWQSHFGGAPHVLGQAVGGIGRPLPIVGVLPPGFRFPDKTDLWYPVNTGFPRAHSQFPRGPKLLRCRAAQTRRLPRAGANRDDFDSPTSRAAVSGH